MYKVIANRIVLFNNSYYTFKVGKESPAIPQEIEDVLIADRVIELVQKEKPVSAPKPISSSPFKSKRTRDDYKQKEVTVEQSDTDIKLEVSEDRHIIKEESLFNYKKEDAK